MKKGKIRQIGAAIMAGGMMLAGAGCGASGEAQSTETVSEQTTEESVEATDGQTIEESAETTGEQTTEESTDTAEESAQGSRIEPIQNTYDFSDLSNMGFAASFTADDVEQEGEQTIIHLTAYDCELFNGPEIENLKAGDILVIDQKEMKVESVEPQSDTWIQINGGLEEDGCDLCKGEDGLYYEMLLESKSYQPVADLTLPLAEDFFFRDSADPEKQEQEYTAEQFLASLQDDVYGFSPNNTTVTAVDGKIAQITRNFMP